jgi:hypothetical protein
MAPQFSTDFLTPHLPLWEKHLAAYRGKPGVRFLEIGAYEGRSTCWLLEHILTDPSARLTVVDPFYEFDLVKWKHGFPGAPGYPPPTHIRIEERFDENMREVGAGNRLIKVKKPSQEYLRTLPLETYDFIYIDGSHVPFDVLRDGILSWDLLKPGGILVFDDYLLHSFSLPYHSPRMAIDAFLCVALDRYEVLASGWQMWMRKTNPTPPPDPLAPPLIGDPEKRKESLAGRASVFLSKLWAYRRY